MPCFVECILNLDIIIKYVVLVNDSTYDSNTEYIFNILQFTNRMLTRTVGMRATKVPPCALSIMKKETGELTVRIWTVVELKTLFWQRKAKELHFCCDRREI